MKQFQKILRTFWTFVEASTNFWTVLRIFEMILKVSEKFEKYGRFRTFVNILFDKSNLHFHHT